MANIWRSEKILAKVVIFAFHLIDRPAELLFYRPYTRQGRILLQNGFTVSTKQPSASEKDRQGQFPLSLSLSLSHELSLADRQFHFYYDSIVRILREPWHLAIRAASSLDKWEDSREDGD